MDNYFLAANLLAVLHGAYLVVFLYLITVSVRGKLSETRMGEYLFWIWIGGKIVSQVVLGECILTMTEQSLRSAQGSSYENGYIQHYASFVGIELSYTAIWFLVMIPLSTAIVSELYWNYRKRRGIFAFLI